MPRCACSSASTSPHPAWHPHSPASAPRWPEPSPVNDNPHPDSRSPSAGRHMCPGQNRRCRTLNDNQDPMTNNRKEIPLSSSTVDYLVESIVDTTRIRAACRALPLGGPDIGSGGPAGAVLSVVREVPGLCDEVDRLARLLGQARYAYANLTAAARAALSAHAEGETDPWWYLRDELGSDPVLPPEPAAGCGGCCP